MAAQRTIRMALVGGGMFGGDVVLRTIEDLERCGIAPYLGAVGLDTRARDLAGLSFRLTSISTRTRASAERLAAAYAARLPGASPSPHWGETPWEEAFASRPADVAFIATPDHLHHQPVLAALRSGAHVMVEKPLALRSMEAGEIAREARRLGRVVGVDMHKRYDPCHRFIFRNLVPRIGTPLYGRAVLEEPLEVSTQTFQWAARSNPFSYVGVHWTDLFGHYLGLEPVSVHAVGQKKLLANWDQHGGAARIPAFDAMQVAVDYSSGLRVYYVNNWINPAEFEGPVNQEMELVGTRGKIEFDQQYRGLRATITGEGSRTFNPHFTHDIDRLAAPAASPAYAGYGKDSIVAIVARALEVELGLETLDSVAGTYPDAESALPSVRTIEAAAAVAERNLQRLAEGRGTPATARITPDAIELLDPWARGPETISGARSA